MPRPPQILIRDDSAADLHTLKVSFHGDPDSQGNWSCRRVLDTDGNGVSLDLLPKNGAALTTSRLIFAHYDPI